MPKTGQLTLDSSVQYMKGVGPRRGRLLGRLGIRTVADLLWHFPRGWEDRRLKKPCFALEEETDHAVFEGRVVDTRLVKAGFRLGIFKAVLESEGRRMEASWYKRLTPRYDAFGVLRKKVYPGARIWVVGRRESSLWRTTKIQVSEFYPSDDLKACRLHVDRIVPVYPLTEGISQTFLREIQYQALQSCASLVPEVLPRNVLSEKQLLSSSQALWGVHFPKSARERDAARRRFAYEELLFLGMAWILKRRQTSGVSKNYGYEIKRHLLTPFREHLGFEFTGAQKRVIREIFDDMQRPQPMTRLLQGDVGSGKTVVALSALLLALENGCQGAFMAPTEILAEQHRITISKFLEGLPVHCELLTSRTRPRQRSAILEGIKEGGVNIVVGTHALLEEDVEFAALRMVVIDEQHRFGVRQRAMLRRKGPPLDMLVMTATPIPRTLALALYGDLDVSTLDEMPPGRQPVETRHVPEKEAFSSVRDEISRGFQAYIVYPVIEESAQRDLKSAKEEAERLKNVVFSDFKVDLIHGQMSGDQKARVMGDFAEGRTDVLVATSVVEVGMDVPNATVMAIMSADRFGLASLHQLRGRVGRGSRLSTCFIVAESKTGDAESRIRTVCETSDGFKIGEQDLRLRGPGELLGTEQSGDLRLKVADIFKDADLLQEARGDALRILSGDSRLTLPEHQALKERLLALYKSKWHWVDLA